MPETEGQMKVHRRDRTRLSVNKNITQTAINFSGLSTLVFVGKQKSMSARSEAN